MILTVVFCIFVAFTAIQILYYFIFSSFLFSSKKKKEESTQAPISSIIFAKNSAVALQKNLNHVLAQNYPKFEIILINNESSDNTTSILQALQEKNKNITIIDVANKEAFWGSKKYVLTLPHIFTDFFRNKSIIDSN